MLADLAQPALERSRIAGRLGVDHRSGPPQRLDALGLDLAGLAARQLFFEAVARGASPLGGFEIGDDRLDQRVGSGDRFGRRTGGAAGETLLPNAPEPARLGRGDGNPRRHHALQKKLPFLGREIRFVAHRRYSSTYTVVS